MPDMLEQITGCCACRLCQAWPARMPPHLQHTRKAATPSLPHDLEPRSEGLHPHTSWAPHVIAAAPGCPQLGASTPPVPAVGAAQRGAQEDRGAQPFTWHGHHRPAHGRNQHARGQVSACHNGIWLLLLFSVSLPFLAGTALLAAGTNTPVAK